MKNLIIGAGEIGKSLYKVFKDKHETHIRDKDDLLVSESKIPIWQTQVEVLNICYPYSPKFIKDTEAYINQYRPLLTIIHSTVPVGTSKKLSAVHSPVHGKHPNLEEGIRTFVKYIGADDHQDAWRAQRFLSDAGITTEFVKGSKTSELSKLLCTTYYGWNIVFMKEVERLCEEHSVPFDQVYTKWNTHYNEGYTKLGMPQFVRPVLEPMPGKIGGHCVINNCYLFDGDISDFILKKNSSLPD